MPAEVPPSYEERVLLVAPTGRDARVTCEALSSSGIACTPCTSLAHMAHELDAGAGALMLTERALKAPDFDDIVKRLDEQPSWSSLPVVLMCRDQDRDARAMRAIERLRNVTVLDRPASMRSMISAVEAALRGRRWQYQIRDQIVAQDRAEDALRRADRRKDEFLATLAHELRNPLAPIRTGLQLIHRSPPAPVVASALSMMDRQLGQLVKLVDELLDVSRIATGKVVLQNQRVDMRTVVSQALEASQPALDTSGHALRVELPDHPLHVIGDPSRLAQALGNVVSNAIKYTPRGGAISVSLAGADDDVLLSVADSGVGIPPEMIDRVFELFAQVDRTLDRAAGGLGIGLSLVRSLVALHGGTVTARSSGIDQGSVFEIRLPSAADAMTSANDDDVGEAPGPAPDRSATPALHVMVVDDNVDAADSLGMLLQSAGHVVRVEYGAQAALRSARQFLPDAIFCDIGMPGMDGHAFAEHLRQDHDFAATTLVALTGWGTEEDLRRSRAAGFDHHLTKPASANGIESILSLRQTAHRPATADRAAERPG